ncbi:MAG: hypothetical protein R3195_11010 [Gemmatimonadota bacterium]|nr:hypothetical protein [Gemmatimonadota bacterium]
MPGAAPRPRTAPAPRTAPDRPRIVALAFAALGATAGCTEPDAGGAGAAVRDSAGIRIVENVTATAARCSVSAAPTLDIGMIEGPQEYQLYRVFDAATLSDGRIAVVNQGSDEIRVYSPDGIFQHSFGSQGEGPGEFRQVFRVWLGAADTLIVGDYRPYRFSFFTPEGEYIRSVQPEPVYVNNPNSLGTMSDGTYVFAYDDPRLPEREGEWVDVTQEVILHDASGAMIDTLAVLPYGRVGWTDLELRSAGRPLFEAVSHVAAGGDRLVIGRGVERELEVFELRADEPLESAPPGTTPTPRIDLGRPGSIIRWSGPDRTVTDADVEEYRRLLREAAADADSDLGRRFIEAELSADRPVAERFPPHAAVELGAGGEIWVQQSAGVAAYDPNREPRTEWLVFDRAGRLECRVTLPFARSYDIFELGADHVLGKFEDDLGVEHVRRYALMHPR